MTHAGIRLRIVRDGEPTTQPRPWIDRTTAQACCNCPALYPSDGKPCPACGSKYAFPIERWLGREAG